MPGCADGHWNSRSAQQKAVHSGQTCSSEKIVHGVSGKLANKCPQIRRWEKNGKKGNQQEEQGLRDLRFPIWQRVATPSRVEVVTREVILGGMSEKPSLAILSSLSPVPEPPPRRLLALAWTQRSIWQGQKHQVLSIKGPQWRVSSLLSGLVYPKKKGPSGLFCLRALMDSPVGVKGQNCSL